MHDFGYIFYDTKPLRFSATKISIQGNYVVLQNSKFQWGRKQIDYGENNGKWSCYCITFPTDERGTGGFQIPLMKLDISTLPKAKESIRIVVKNYWEKLKTQHLKDEDLRSQVMGFTSVALEDDDTLTVAG